MTTTTILTTCSFYRDGINDPRFQFAIDTLDAAQGKYPVCVVEGSPDRRVADAYRARKAFVFPETLPGLGTAKRRSYAVATELAIKNGIEIIQALEIEKTGMVDLVEQAIAPINEGTADVSVAKRSEASWLTYPRFQKETEQQANAAFEDEFGEEFDMMFGPVGILVGPAIGPFLVPNNLYLPERVPDEYIQMHGIMTCYLQGIHVVSSDPLDFVYPEQQRLQEEGDPAMEAKRVRQRDDLIRTFQVFARELEEA